MTDKKGQGAAARRQERVGVVTTAKMQKTVVVRLDRRVPHPTYGKMVTRSSKVKAHDEANSAKRGDTVCVFLQQILKQH